jgi:hypothetical protein
VLPFALLFSGFDEKVMPYISENDKSVLILEIPGLCMRRDLIPVRVGPVYVVLLHMQEFYRWYQVKILYEIFISIREHYTSKEAIGSIPGDEMALHWFDSDMTKTKKTSQMKHFEEPKERHAVP